MPPITSRMMGERAIKAESKTTVIAVPVVTAPDTVQTESQPSAMEPQSAAEALRLGAGSVLLIDYSAQGDASLSADEEATLKDVLGQRLFKLDSDGVLHLTVVGAVPLMGLNAREAAERLKADSLLRNLDVSVVILPVGNYGISALTIFGHEALTTGTGPQPAANLPVPDDYPVGPGDVFSVQLFGQTSDSYSLEVSNDGVLTLPNVGPLPVAGMTLGEVKRTVQEQVQRRNLGVSAYLSIAQLRSITVFLLGEVNQPGARTVSALATVTNALLAAGGIRDSGSLRRIELRRGRSAPVPFDLYGMLMRGDKSGDRRLQNGDVIFVPTVGSLVGIGGAVIRPAYYELRSSGSGSTVGDLIGLAGGLAADANRDGAQLQRISSGGRTVIDLDVGEAAGLQTGLRNGDIVVIPALDSRLALNVTLRGHARKTGAYQWRSGMVLADLFDGGRNLLPTTDRTYAVVSSTIGGSLRPVRAVPLDRAGKVPLQDGDEVILFRADAPTERQAYLRPVLERLRTAATASEPAQVVSVDGEVRAPGDYPLTLEMRVSDLLHAAAFPTESALLGNAELTRYRNENGTVKVEYRDIDLTAALAGNADQDVMLTAHDHLTIRQIPGWQDATSIAIYGEVRFPGVFRISRNEKLSSVLNRAGGLTDVANPRGPIFLRQQLRQQERDNLNALITRLEASIAAQSVNKLRNPEQEEAITQGSQLIGQLKSLEPQGRMVIDLAPLLTDMKAGKESAHDLMMQNGDELFIPPRVDQVSVMGEVFFPTSHRWSKDRKRDDYVNMSGGFTSRSDKKWVYVIRADGSAPSNKKLSGSAKLAPGDTVVVPMDLDPLRPLELWSTITRIFFDIGVTVAQLNESFGTTERVIIHEQ